MKTKQRIRYNPVKNIWEIYTETHNEWNQHSLVELTEEKRALYKVVSYRYTWCEAAYFFDWVQPNTKM